MTTTVHISVTVAHWRSCSTPTARLKFPALREDQWRLGNAAIYRFAALVEEASAAINPAPRWVVRADCHASEVALELITEDPVEMDAGLRVLRAARDLMPGAKEG